ncbi:hypothetical protein J7L67_02430 [bacterium]|nr:hypothetical protein [bacterium]
MIKQFLKIYLKKNVEKWLFFVLLCGASAMIIWFVLHLPYFSSSTFEKKINKKLIDSDIEKDIISEYTQLFSEIEKPHIFINDYQRDPFSPDIERIECPQCGKFVSKKVDVCPFCSYLFDTDNDGMPNQWEKKYSLNAYDPDDAYLDKDGDTFSNFDEFNAKTNPIDPFSKPEHYNPLSRYRLRKIFKKPLDLLFDGYMLLPDGSYSFVINYGNASYFKKLGETISEFTIENFEKKEVPIIRDGVEVSIDLSELVLKSKSGETITLAFHKVTAQNQWWALIEDLDAQKNYEFRDGDKFGNFIIKTITANEVKIRDDEGNNYNLTYKRSSGS